MGFGLIQNQILYVITLKILHFRYAHTVIGIMKLVKIKAKWIWFCKF